VLSKEPRTMTNTTTTISEEKVYTLDQLIHKLTEKSFSTDFTVQAAFELRSMQHKMRKMEQEIDRLKSTEKIDWYSNKYVNKTA
jgi:hypothetical protein